MILHDTVGKLFFDPRNHRNNSNHKNRTHTAPESGFMSCTIDFDAGRLIAACRACFAGKRVGPNENPSLTALPGE